MRGCSYRAYQLDPIRWFGPRNVGLTADGRIDQGAAEGYHRLTTQLADGRDAADHAGCLLAIVSIGNQRFSSLFHTMIVPVGTWI